MRPLYRAAALSGKGPYDIIHSHFGPNGQLALYLRDIGALQGKIITTFHGYDLTKHVDQYGKGVYHELFMRGDLFLPVSCRWEKRLIELGCRKDKILHHRMGIDLKRHALSKRTFGEKKNIRVLSVGRLVEKKGIEYGIRGIGKAINSYPNIEYTIVGDGPLKEQLAGTIKSQQLEMHVKMVGAQVKEKVSCFMRNSDFLLCPSITARDGDQEGIPVVLMEAMASGLPVIGTFHSGIPELIIDGKTGVLVEERDGEGLAKKIKYLIENPTVAQEISANARKHVEKYYDIHKLNERLFDTYRSIIKGQIVKDDSFTCVQ